MNSWQPLQDDEYQMVSNYVIVNGSKLIAGYRGGIITVELTDNVRLCVQELTSMVEWVRLEDLPPGFVFVTQKGVLAVKSEYHDSFAGHRMCVLLQSGEYAHFADGDDTLVRALEVQP